MSRESISRLLKDVKQLIGHPMNDLGIFYIHHESIMLKGYAMIVGPKDTPYFGGYYLFEINYPVEYPFLPPVVKSSTQGNGVRFNPNLYCNGKVCLSVLNTWFGSSWSACESLRTVLLHLQMVFNPNPLMNEPGITEPYLCASYAKSIEYHNLDVAVCNIINKSPGYYLPYFDLFYEIILEKFRTNRNELKQLAETRNRTNDRVISLVVPLYNMVTVTDYDGLLLKIENIINI